MSSKANMKMVNGRVSESAAIQAAQVLAQQGLTISSFIRNSIEHVARVGEVPESGLPAEESAPDLNRLRDLVRTLESLPMPGKQDFPNLSEDEMVERILMERYGY